ncbi:hypothetical protein JZM24_17275 [Candidatus Sodalis endolongispinus]|uniref:Uncharacterized protein n=1 Tax=Candidatus Sodalis endolongispinus TaxID=2812662 RepID=A0ABS5YFI0_9GAMM|nr:hypothetical protein [Candidatus Sodalis endolongispinus]MBT9433412.1 hypothetical protein [Candidatus Sodalis endolongispinus]
MVKDTAQTTSEFETALKINYNEIMKSESPITQDLTDKFNENFNNIMRFSACANFLTSIVRDAITSVQNVFLGGDDFGNSIQNCIKVKLTEMHRKFGSASADMDYDSEIEDLAHIAKVAAERERKRGEKDNAGQGSDSFSIASLSQETALATGVILGAGAIALGAMIAGKGASDKISSTVVDGTLSLTEGAIRASVTTPSNSADTLPGIPSLESSQGDDISAIAEQHEDSVGNVTTDYGSTGTGDLPSESDPLHEMAQSSGTSTALTSRVEVLTEMIEKLNSLRKNIAAVKENISKSAQEADHAYIELKEITGKRMVYGDTIYNTTLNKQAYIKYTSRNEKHRKLSLEYNALKDLEKESISLIEKLKQ